MGESRTVHIQESLAVILNVLFQKFNKNPIHGAAVEVAVYPVLLLNESFVGFRDVGVARVLSDGFVAFVAVVVSSLLNQLSLELLLINLLGLKSYLDKHLDTFGDEDTLNHFSVSFLFDLGKDL